MKTLNKFTIWLSIALLGMLLFGLLPSALSFPSNVVAYLPITFTNKQSIAVPANAPLSFTFNALAYQQYETNTLNNTELFFPNGTVAHSWLEGNLLNEAGNANILFQSENVLFWFKSPPSNTFLSANTGTATTNTIYLGFAGNAVTTANNLWSANPGIDGASFQLANSIVMNTATARNEDSGANVFSYYCNFGGQTSLPCGFNNFYPNGVNDIFNPTNTQILNLLTGTSPTPPGGWNQNAITANTPIGANVPGNTFEGAFIYTKAASGVLGTEFGLVNHPLSGWVNICGGVQYGILSLATSLAVCGSNAGYGHSYTIQATFPNTESIYGFSIINSLVANYILNYTYLGTVTDPYSGGAGTGNVVIGTQNTVNPSSIFWLRLRATPPSNVMPSASFGNVVITINQLIATPNPYTFSNTSISLGQKSLANTVISNGYAGTILYTGNWAWVGPSTNVLSLSNTPSVNLAANNALTFVLNSIASNSLSITIGSNTYTVNSIGTNTIYGTWTFNGFASDANGDVSPTPQLTNTIIINPLLTSTKFTASNAIVDQNSYQTLNALITGGTNSYTYNFIVYNAPGQIANQLSVNTLTSNIYTFQINPSWGIGTLTANLIVTDGETTPEKVTNSITFTVDTTLNANPPTPTTATIDNGQTITLSANPTGGTGSYTTYQWYTDTTNNCLSLSIIGGATSSTYAASPTSNTFYCYVVTDSALGVATSSAPANIIVNPPYSFNTLTSNPTLSATLDTGQSISFTANINGGTSSYTYNFQIVNTITGITIANQLWSNSLTSNTFIWIIPSSVASNTIKANVLITDSAYSPQSVNSIYLATLTINPALGQPSISPSASQKYDYGQTIIWSSIATPGSLAYTFNWIAVNTITGSLLANALYNNVASSSNSFGWTFPYLDNGNSVYANTIVTDNSALPITLNSIESGTITLDTDLGVPSLTVSNTPTVYDGQYENFVATLPPSNTGTSTYTYNFLVVNDISGSLLTNALYVGVSSTTNSFLWLVPSADDGNTFKANVIITDNATTPVIVNSIKSAEVTILSSYAPPSILISAASNIIADVGQYETFTGTIISGGTSPFTYNFMVVNSATLGTITHNALYSNSLTTNTFTFQTVSADTSNSQEKANVIVTDANPSTVSSIYSSLFTVNPKLVFTSITPSSSQIYDVNEIVTFTATISGGSPNYIYKWIIANSVTKTVLNTTTFGANGLASNSFAFTINSNLVGNTIYANVIVTDSATTNSIVNSINSGIITINPQLFSNSWTASNSILSLNQYQLLTATVIPGSSTYTYNFLVYNAIGSLVANALYNNVGLTSNSFFFKVIPAWNAGLYRANVIVTDSADPETVTNTLTFTVGPIINISSPSNAIVDVGQYETFVANEIGAISPFTYNYFIPNSITLSKIAHSASYVNSLTTNTFTFQVTAPDVFNSPEQANVFLNDAGTNVINSTYSNTFIINPAITFANPAITPLNPIISAGTHETLTATWTGGTANYQVKWYSSPFAAATCTISNTLIATHSSIAAQTDSLTVTPSSNTLYCVTVADSASVNTITSISAYDTVNVIGTIISSGKTVILLPTTDPKSDNMLAIFLMAVSIALFCIRIALRNNKGYQWVVIGAISALFFFMGFYYITFPPSTAGIVNSVITNSTGNLFNITTNSISYNSAVPISSPGWYLLVIFTMSWIGLLIIFVIQDFLVASGHMDSTQ